MSINIQEWNTQLNLLDRLWLYGERNISQLDLAPTFSYRVPDIAIRAALVCHCACLTKMEEPVDFARFKAWLENM